MKKVVSVGYSNTAKMLNSSLDMVKNKLYNHKNEIESTGKKVTAIFLKEAHLGISEN